MIDHTDLDIRYAAHAARVGRVNREGWKRPTATSGRALRAMLATALIGLAERLAPPARHPARAEPLSAPQHP